MNNAKLKVVLTGVLLIFAIIPALILGAVGTFSLMGFETNAKTDTLNTVSLSKSAAVDQVFAGYISDVDVIAKLDAVIDTADNGSSSADSIIKAYAENNSDVLDILVIDDKGTVVASAKGSASGSFEHFNSDGMPAVSTVMAWEKYQTDGIFVSKEIYADPDNKTGGKLGYVCMVVSLGADSGLAKAVSGTYLSGAHLVLVDSEGNALNFDGSGTVMKSGQLDGTFAAEIPNMFAMASNVSGTNNTENMITGTVGKYAYACGIVPNVTTWRWVGIADTGFFGKFSMPTNLIGWGVILVVCALASVIAIVIISRFVGSMHEMLNTMEQIGKENGSSEVRFKVKNRKSELGEIQTSFNELLDEVYLSEERHRTIAELSDNMLFEWDFHKERMYVSPNALAKFDLTPSESTLSNGKFIDSLMSAEDAEKYKRDINTLLKNKNGYSAEYQLKTKSGAVIWISLRAVCITDRLGEPLRVVGVITDIDNDKKMELQLSERASYDFLSQLYNRNTFIRTLTSEIDRRGQNKIGIMFIDVDDFKFINDRYGHTIGDEVIRYVADSIRKKVDDRGGFAGRFGGDEFVLCYTNQEDIANLETIAMNIIDELYVGYTTNDGTIINVRVSIGITYCPEHSDNVNDLISYADTAMYFVKKNGKTNYHVYMPEDSATGEYIDPEGY